MALALGIGDLLDRPTHELSGGELQRVALGAALGVRPRLVLLDEPTSQLDPVAGEELIWLLRRLNEEQGTTVVVADHRLERTLPAADRVLVLDDGRAVFDGAPRDFLAWAARHSPALQTPAAYIGAMGSRRTHEDRLERLREAGLAEAQLARLASPIGLDIGARTPEETAISVAAEIVQARWGGSGQRLGELDGPIHHGGDLERGTPPESGAVVEGTSRAR